VYRDVSTRHNKILHPLPDNLGVTTVSTNHGTVPTYWCKTKDIATHLRARTALITKSDTSANKEIPFFRKANRVLLCEPFARRLGLFLCPSHATCWTLGRPFPYSDISSAVTFRTPDSGRHSTQLFHTSDFYVFEDANNGSGAQNGCLYLPCNPGARPPTHNLTFNWEQLRLHIPSTCPRLSLHP